MENHSQLKKYKLCLLGHGLFAQKVFDHLRPYIQETDFENCQCAIVLNFGKIFSKTELNKPKFGIVNIHPSLLPKYRGPTPIQTALYENEKQTGVSIIKLDSEVDHGPIIAQKRIDISLEDDYESLTEKLIDLTNSVLINTLCDYLSGNIKPSNQNHNLATFTHKKMIDEVSINISDDDLTKYLKVRAWNKEPGVFVRLSGFNLKIIKSSLLNNKFIPEIVQREGKKPMNYSDFLKGYRGNIEI